MRTALLLLCAGCCVDTFEVDTDLSHQPRAQLAVGSATFDGDLATDTTPTGYNTTLTTADGQVFTLLVPSRFNGSYPTTVGTSSVTITTDVTLGEVCLAADQEDYGTGRCGFTYVGTIDITGDATGTWTLDQLAVVKPGDPDC